MSGHSKWSSIKHQKGITDARRGQLFTKLTREIIVSARIGGGNPDMNIRLRFAIQKARESNMPLDNVERAVKKGSGEGGSQEQLEETSYEGYGPGGTAILLQALTDNRNRTASEVRSTFHRYGGSLGESGCVAWIFEPKGVVSVEIDAEKADELTLLAIDAGAEDFQLEDSTLEVYASLESFEAVRQSLEESEAKVKLAELSMVPKTTVTLAERTAGQTLRLLDRLEELDDIQKVYSNGDFPDEALAKYQAEE